MTWKKTCFILVTENGPRARSIFAFYSYKYIMVIFGPVYMYAKRLTVIV